MSGTDVIGKRSGVGSGVMLAGAVALLALPSAVLAFGSSFSIAPDGADGRLDSFAANEAQLAAGIPVRSLGAGHRFRFTPAGTPNRPDRSVTIAVRVDAQTAEAITVRGSRIAAAPVPTATTLGIAPTAFTLGVSRGYQSFAQTLATPVEIRKIEMPDLATYEPSKTAPASSRFAPRISLNERQVPGTAPRTFSDGEDQVDLGGSYRLTRNIDVTAGVRYSQERERLSPVTDGKQDNQAVYLGTQFRF